jgi:chaperonin GroES
MKFRPLHDRVVVKRIEADEKTKGGIIIPDTAKEKPQEAEVIAVGPGKLTDDGKRAAMDVRVGDQVIYGKYSGMPYRAGDDELIILKASDILAKIG